MVHEPAWIRAVWRLIAWSLTAIGLIYAVLGTIVVLGFLLEFVDAPDTVDSRVQPLQLAGLVAVLPAGVGLIVLGTAIRRANRWARRITLALVAFVVFAVVVGSILTVR